MTLANSRPFSAASPSARAARIREKCPWVTTTTGSAHVATRASRKASARIPTVVGGFTVGASVAPNVPAGCQQTDLVVGQALVVAVLIFRDKRIHCYRPAGRPVGQGEGGCCDGTLAGAGKRQDALAGQHALDQRRQRGGLPVTVRCQGHIGGAGISAGQNPFGLTVADDDQFHRGSPSPRYSGPMQPVVV